MLAVLVWLCEHLQEGSGRNVLCCPQPLLQVLDVLLHDAGGSGFVGQDVLYYLSMEVGEQIFCWPFSFWHKMWSPGEAEDRELHAKIHHHFLVVFKEIISEFLIPVLLFSNRFCSCLICWNDNSVGECRRRFVLMVNGGRGWVHIIAQWHVVRPLPRYELRELPSF